MNIRCEKCGRKLGDIEGIIGEPKGYFCGIEFGTHEDGSPIETSEDIISEEKDLHKRIDELLLAVKKLQERQTETIEEV